MDLTIKIMKTFKQTNTDLLKPEVLFVYVCDLSITILNNANRVSPIAQSVTTRVINQRVVSSNPDCAIQYFG